MIDPSAVTSTAAIVSHGVPVPPFPLQKNHPPPQTPQTPPPKSRLIKLLTNRRICEQSCESYKLLPSSRRRRLLVGGNSD